MTDTPATTLPPSAAKPLNFAAYIPAATHDKCSDANPYGWAWNTHHIDNANFVGALAQEAIAARASVVLVHASWGCERATLKILDGYPHTTVLMSPDRERSQSAALYQALDACHGTRTTVIAWSGPPASPRLACVGQWLEYVPWNHPSLAGVVVDSMAYPLAMDDDYMQWFTRLYLVGTKRKLWTEGPFRSESLKDTRSWALSEAHTACDFGTWCQRAHDPEWDHTPPSMILLTGTDADRAAYHRLGILDDGPRAVERAMVRAHAWCAALWPSTLCAIPIHRLSVGELAQLQSQCGEGANP